MLLTAAQSSVTLCATLTHSKVGLGNSIRTGEKPPLSTVVFLCLPKIIKAESIRFNSFMVGVRGTLRGCWNLFPVYQPFTSTAQSLVTFGGGLKTTEQELVMSQHHYTQETAKQKPLTIHVSHIKQQSLQKQVEIISSSLDSFCCDAHTKARAILKADALELVRMLDELEQNTPRKTSLFNVLAKDTRQLIAKQVSFNQAKQYPDAIVKFSCMVGGAA